VIGPDHELTAWHGRKLIVKGNPKLFGKRKLKIWWHHADDGRSFSINANALSDNVEVAIEIPLPNLVTQNGVFFGAGLVVVSGEVAAHDRRNADNLKEILGDVGASVTLRIIFVAHVDCRSAQITGHLGERLLGRAQILVILSRRDIAETEIIVWRTGLGINQPHAHQLFWMRKRKPEQYRGVDDCELSGR